MDTFTIFGVQFLLSILCYSLIARWYLAPWLENKPLFSVLMVITFPHAFRHLGLVFLVPSLVSPGLPHSFAFFAAYGDFITGLLALLSLFSLRQGWKVSLKLVLLFNTVGSVDLVNALSHAEAIPHLQTAWYIPTFFVPLLLVTHAMSFFILFQNWRIKKE